MPADYREYIGQMQESFGELDTVLGEIDSMTEGELTDRYLVKAVFYSLYFGATGSGWMPLITSGLRSAL